MTDIQLILLIIVGVCAVWQVTVIGMAFAMMSSGKYNKVTIGFLPTIIAVPLLIAVVLL